MVTLPLSVHLSWHIVVIDLAVVDMVAKRKTTTNPPYFPPELQLPTVTGTIVWAGDGVEVWKNAGRIWPWRSRNLSFPDCCRCCSCCCRRQLHLLPPRQHYLSPSATRQVFMWGPAVGVIDVVFVDVISQHGRCCDRPAVHRRDCTRERVGTHGRSLAIAAVFGLKHRLGLLRHVSGSTSASL